MRATSRRIGSRKCCSSASAASAAAASELLLVLDEIDEHVVTKGLGCREERATAVDRRQLLDERLEVAVGVEHERVDADVVLGAANDLAQCCLDGLRHRRIVEEDVTARRDVRRRLA